MEREKILSEQRDVHGFFEKKADHAFQGVCAAQTRLSEAQSESHRRERRMRNVDIALHETGMPLQSQRMELYRANQLINQTRRKKSWLCDESDMRIRAFQGDRARNCREIEELQRIFCVDTERARHLRCDEPSTQKEENNSTVNQFMVQIQELQDKVNSLNDAKESHDPETASSSGVSHVPSQLMSIRTARGMTSRDTELIVYIRTRFEGLLARGESSSALFEKSKNLALSSCRLTPIGTGKFAEKGEGLREEPQDFSIPTPRFASKVFDMESSI